MKKTKKGTIVTSITMPEDVYNVVADRAEHEERSFSKMVTRLLKEVI